MDVREKLVDDVHGKLMGLLQRAPYIRCEDVYRQYAVNWLMNNGVTVQEWISVPADELKNHIGVPVCFSRKLDGCSWWAIIRGIKGDKVSTDYDGYFKVSEYGETWMVKYLPLPQPPKENDYAVTPRHTSRI